MRHRASPDGVVQSETGRTAVADVGVPTTAVEAVEDGGRSPGCPTRRRVGAAVDIGSRVRVIAPWGEDEYVIVSPQAADPQRGRISVLSPVGAALLGRWLGAEVSVKAPGGVQSLTILGVIPPSAAGVAAGDARRSSP